VAITGQPPSFFPNRSRTTRCRHPPRIIPQSRSTQTFRSSGRISNDRVRKELLGYLWMALLFAPAIDFAYSLFIPYFSKWFTPHNSQHYPTDFPAPLSDDILGGRLRFWLF
jgi:hypothetical protein